MEQPEDQNLISPSSSSQSEDSLGKRGFQYPDNEAAFSNSDNQEEEKQVIMDSLDSERRGHYIGRLPPDDMTFDDGPLQGESPNHHLMSQDALFRGDIKIDSERSQCTQESCSAPEDSSDGGQQQMVSRSKGGLAKIRKPINLRIRGSSNEGEEEQEKELIEALNTIEFSLINAGSANKNNSVFDSASEAIQTSKFPANSDRQFQSGKKTGKHSNLSGNNPSASNSNNLLSNEYSYSPDFRDNSSNLPPLDQASDSYSPAIAYGLRKSYIEKSAGQAIQQNQMIFKAHHLPQLSQPNFGAKNQQPYCTQGSMLRYEEFEGECYTHSSHQNQDTVNTPSAGQVFFGATNPDNTINMNSVISSETLRAQEQNRMNSEVTSDRIYERGDTYESQNNQEQLYSNEYELSPKEEQNYDFPVSPNGGLERKMPTLSIITEEDTQLDQRSVSQYFRMASNISVGGKTIKQENRRQNSYGLAPGSHSGQSQDISRSASIGVAPDSSYYDEHIMRSSSQPMSSQNRKQHSSQSPVEYAQNKRMSIPKSDNNPSQDYQQHNDSNSQYITIPGDFIRSTTNFLEDKTRQASQRLSYDMKPSRDEDGEDSFLIRMHSQDNAMRQSQVHNNIYYPLLAPGNQPELCLISDEDLLSNLDRPSRLIIPNHEFISEEGDRTDGGYNKNLTPHSSLKISGRNYNPGAANSPFIIDDYQLMQKLKENQALIESLRHDNQFLTGQIMSKDEQLKELIQRNEDLEGQVASLEERLDAEALVISSQQQNDMEFTMGIKNRSAGVQNGSKRDFEVQVNIKKPDSRRNSAKNPRKLSSNLKMTPKREIIDFQVDQQSDSNANGTNINQTPSIQRINANSSIHKESSPMLNKQNSNPQKSSSNSNLLSQQQEMIQTLQTQIRNLKEMLANLQRDHFIDKEKIEGNDHVVRTLNNELKLINAECVSQQSQNAELVKIVRELERMVEGQKINANDMKIEHEVLMQQMKQRNADLKDELDRYKQKEIIAKVVEQGTSTTSLEPFISDQEVQVDIQTAKQKFHTRTPSQYSNQNSKEGTQQYPHTIPLPENTSPNQPFEYEPLHSNPFIQANKASYSGYAQGYPQFSGSSTSNITIINNKQELSMMIEARNNELRAIELQNEIKLHRNQLMRENQEMLNINISQKEEFRLKLKKRESKIEKLEGQVKEQERINNELRVKLDDAQGKMSDVRLKMEGKVQEREFKVITLKNQIAQLQQQLMNQALTVGQIPQTQYNSARLYNQQELHTMVNNIVQAKMLNFYQGQQDYQSSSPSDLLRHQRSRSQEQHLQQAMNREKQESIRQHNNQPNQSRRTISPNIEQLKNQYDSSRYGIEPLSVLSAALIHDEFYGHNIKRRFENTQVQQRQPTLSNSSPLSAPRSDHLNRSKPKSYCAVRDQSLDMNKNDSTRRMKIFVSPNQSQVVNNRLGKTKDSATSPLTNHPIVPHELLNLSEAPISNNFDQSRISEQKSFSNPAAQTINHVEAFRLDSNREQKQKNDLRDKIQKKADFIQLSRNKQKMGREDGSSLKVLKNALSEGDFFKRRKSANKVVPLADTLQKVCTSEISQLCDDRLEESRQIQHLSDQKLAQPQRTQLMVEELVTFSNERDQEMKSQMDNQRRLQVEPIQLKMHQRDSLNGGYQESYHSATFRKMSTNQNNSPIRNLQQNFDNVHFQSQSPQPYFNQSQALTLNPSHQQYYQQQQPYRNNPYTVNHSPYATLLQQQTDLSDGDNNLIYSNEEELSAVVALTPSQSLSPMDASNKNEKKKNQDYLRKLRIRERQSKTRVAAYQPLKEPQAEEVPNNQVNSTMIGESSLGRRMQGQSIISLIQNEDQRHFNIITEKKPPLSQEKRRPQQNLQHVAQLDSPMVISMYESVNLPIYESKESDSRPVSNAISQSYLQPCVTSSADLSVDESLRKQQKLEDIMRKYGRSMLYQ